MKDLNYPAMDHAEIEMRLWEYIDGFSTAEEKSVIEKLVAENAEWKAKYHELLEVHQSLNLVELEQPSMRFTKNVMEEISRLQITPAAMSFLCIDHDGIDHQRIDLPFPPVTCFAANLVG